MLAPYDRGGKARVGRVFSLVKIDLVPAVRVCGSTHLRQTAAGGAEKAASFSAGVRP